MALVVFLRGVNVGGHRVFRPAALAEQLTHFGAVNIGAAGTFVIRGPVGRATLRAELRRRLPFETDIVICTAREIAGLMAGHPFGHRPARPGIVRFASVLSRPPRVAPKLPASFPPRGRWLLQVLTRDHRFLIGHYRRHMETIRHFGALDRVCGAPVTTRNWNTMTAVASALGVGGKAEGRGAGDADKPSKRSRTVVKKAAGRRAAAKPVLLAGGNPQVAKADGDAPVQAYIASMPGWKRDIGRRLDALVVRHVPNVRKAVRWNSPFYGIGGQGWFMAFHVFTSCVKVTFFKGTSLQPVPGGGTAKDARWIDIHEHDLDEAQLAAWALQASSIPGWGK
jgi:uncharacterized protein (DUF1697 family)